MDGKVAFLFGAGISIPAGFPTTREITSWVLSPTWYKGKLG
jgi:NAD-dependent SIR2 family protein deacetylase